MTLCCSPRSGIFAQRCSAGWLMRRRMFTPSAFNTGKSARACIGGLCIRRSRRTGGIGNVAALFPDRYKELIAWHPAWWIALEKNAAFPKLRRTQDLSNAAMDYVGPIRDRAAAGKLIDTVEDMFDLCRYHHILVQTPHGKACAYKEMGKCPAPCDGSVPLEWYHGQIRAAFRYISDEGGGGGYREEWRAGEIFDMKAAAQQLAFEQAARIKQRIERSNLVTAESYEHMGRLEDFAFLSLQPGQGRTNIEPWLIHGGRVECLAQFKKKEIGAWAEMFFGVVRERIGGGVTAPVDAGGGAGVEQIGIVAHHLFRRERDAGLYLRVRDIERGGAAWIVRRAAEWLERKTVASGVAEHASDKAPDQHEIPAPEIAPEVAPQNV